MSLNSNDEDTCKKMISSFQNQDLQLLLRTFGSREVGTNSELKKRALKLLRIRTERFNRLTYIAKIVEIYINMHDNQLPNAFNNMMTDNVSTSNLLTQFPTNVTLKKLPFYEVIFELHRLTTLFGHTECTLPNCPKGMKEAYFYIRLTPEQINLISLHRNISNMRSKYIYKVVIRICHLETGAIEISDRYPCNLYIRVCDKLCPLSSGRSTTMSRTNKKEIASPIDCSSDLKLNPTMMSKVTINWVPDGYTYAVKMFLVKHYTSEILLKKLQDKKAVSSEVTKNIIIKKLLKVDPDLATVSNRFSLVCPLSKKRMKIPTKSVNCSHLECFDAYSFILINEKISSWLCPICKNPCLYDDLQIESYFFDIVRNPNLSDSCEEIELLPDGSWKEVYGITNCEGADPKEKRTDSIDLIDGDDAHDENLAKDFNKKLNPENSNSASKDKKKNKNVHRFNNKR